MRLIVREDHSSPVTAITACFLGGSRFETRSRQGISYFTQRLAPRGTHLRSAEQVAEDLEFLGGTFSPFASKDLFGVSLTLLSRHFSAGLRLMAESLRFPAFAEVEVDRERRNLLLELARRADDTLSFALELSEGVLYRRHPYRFPIRGVEDSIQRFTPEELRRWHARTYTPDRMVLAVVGDQRPAEVAETVGEVFHGFQPSGWSPRAIVAEAPVSARRQRTVRRAKRQAALALAFLAPRFGTEEADAFEVLHHLLAGMGSRLFTELRDRLGLGYVVNASLDTRCDSGCFKVFVATRPDQVRLARRGLLGELDRIRREPVATSELMRAKKYMLGLFEISQQRKATQAFRLAMCELLGAGYQAVDDHPRRIRAVTAERVHQVAQRYLTVEHPCVAQVLP
ncbi:MAG: pitrilysin family protein [Candidatus Eremiobacterota bacterium]